MKRRSFSNLRSPKVQFDDSVIFSINQSFLEESPQREQIAGVYKNLIGQTPLNAHLLIYLEMFLYFGSLIFKRIGSPANTLYPFNDLHLIPQNHPEYFRNANIDQFYLKRVCFLMQPSYGRSSLNAIWRAYINDVSPELRLFDYVEDENEVVWVKDNPSCIRDVEFIKGLYREVIEDSRNLQLIVRFRPFITDNHPDQQMIIKPNTYVDIQKNKNNKDIRKKLTEVYPNYMFKDLHHFIMSDHLERVISQKKGYDDMNRILDLRGTAIELSRETGDQKWFDIYQDIELKKVDYQQSEFVHENFQFDSLNHVIGRLGAGKSVLTKLLIKNLSKHNKRILILESDVLKCFKLLEELKEIGVKAAVFLGDGNIQRHQNAYVKANAHKSSNLAMFVNDNAEQLRILSDFNYTHEILKKHFENARKPSSQLIELDLHDKTLEFVAPDYQFNGEYEKYKMLTDAEVWIGNYEALLKSKVPYFADMFERNYFTLGWLRSDLIIGDEYDLAQLRFDDAHIQKLNLVTDRTDKVKNFLDYMYNVVTEIHKSVTKGFIGTYADAITTSQRLGRYLYSSVFPRRVIRDILTNKTFTRDNLVHGFYHHFIKESNDQKEVVRFLADFLNTKTEKVKLLSPSLRGIYYELMDYYMPRGANESSEADKQEIRFDLMNAMLDCLQEEFNVKFKKRAFHEEVFSHEIIDRLDLLLAYSIFDYYNRYLINEYNTFMLYLEQENKELIGSFDAMIQVNKEAYIPSALLSDLVAYRFSSENDENDRLQMLYYFGVGRNLLSSLPNTFEHIELANKPAVLLLSATSYIPGSSTYHTKVKPHWLLSNRNQRSQKIDLSFLPVKDEQNQEAIKVSGLDSIEKKGKSLRKLIHYFIQDGQFERDFVRMQEEYELLNEEDKIQGKRRIIAFPVFSFETAEILGRILKEETTYSVRVQYVEDKYAKGVKIEFEEGFHVRKNDIENLYENHVDMFVFVASSVGRGLNILQGEKSKNSLIGSMYFLIRPYPNPDDFNDVIHQLHSSFESFLEIADKQVPYEEPLFKYWYAVERKIRGLYIDLMNKRIYWNSLSDENKKVITLNMLTMLYQTIGRGLRGDTNLHVYFVDAAFAPSTAAKAINGLPVDPNEEKYSSSMLAMMEHIITNESDFLMDVLFAPLKEAIKGIALINKKESILP